MTYNGGYSGKERVAAGRIERRCRKCEAWWPLDRFERSKLCMRGRTWECRGCRAERKAANKARKAEARA